MSLVGAGIHNPMKLVIRALSFEHPWSMRFGKRIGPVVVA
jgi:hypothetical protein